uniref:Cell cycle checkpoint protein RAD17-like n=1 Tax=Hirondellea gigas TaxID=1518452 RepID=A0A6A7G1D6_9CRUS
MKRQWVASSFDDDFAISSPPTSSVKEKTVTPTKVHTSLRRKTPMIRKHVAEPGARKLWSEETVHKEQLAVHKKKVQEVEQWLINAFTGVKGYRVLLLTGPAGCGKTACVRAVAAEMGVNCKEWINSTTSAYNQYSTENINWTNTDAKWVPGDSVSESGQVSQFREFVTRVNKYGSVATATTDHPVNSSQLLLVEDLPNAFYRDPVQLHDVIRRYAASGCSPAVFIVSDSPQQQHSAKYLFPPHLHSSVALTNIQFNAVASTLMSKALCQCCVRHDVTAPTDLLHSITESSTGDIRTAVNALQFSLDHHVSDSDSPLFSTKASKGKKKATRGGSSKSSSKAKTSNLENPLAAIGGKDPSLEMFRAIGKVLYCKRSESDPAQKLPEHLQREERVPAIENAEVILDKCPLMPTTFLSFLHHNYSSFVPDVDAALTAISYLTDADVLLGHWTEKDVLSQYSSTAVRGIMHAVGSSSKTTTEGSFSNKRSFHPLTGPVLPTVDKAAAARMSNIRSAYQHQDMYDLTTHILPYAFKIKRNIYTPSSGLLRDIGEVGRSSSSSWSSSGTAAAALQLSLDQHCSFVAPHLGDDNQEPDAYELDYPVDIQEDSD